MARTASRACPRGSLFGLVSLKPDMAMYAVVSVVFLACFLLIHRIVHSPFGQVLKAIRENEPRATSLGYRTDSYKLIAFVLSAALAGVAGGMNCIVNNISTLTNVENQLSGQVVLMALLGGLGTIFGPVVGAAIIVAAEVALSEAGSWSLVLQGMIFIVCVLAFPPGHRGGDRGSAACVAVGGIKGRSLPLAGCARQLGPSRTYRAVRATLGPCPPNFAHSGIHAGMPVQSQFEPPVSDQGRR